MRNLRKLDERLSPRNFQFLFFFFVWKIQFFRSAGNVIQQIKILALGSVHIERADAKLLAQLGRHKYLIA